MVGEHVYMDAKCNIAVKLDPKAKVLNVGANFKVILHIGGKSYCAVPGEEVAREDPKDAN